MKLQAFVLTLLAVRTCSSVSPSDIDPIILQQWREAQIELQRLNPPVRGNVGAVEPYGFRFEEWADTFSCGEVVNAAGCFTAPALIRYASQYKNTVIKHEAKHAILYTLHDPRWRCIEHEEGCR